MKTILVTGAAGYIGRHVVKKALDMGYRVIASDFAFKGVDERAEFCDVPIFSGDKNIYAALGKPDVCIHMAWRDGFRHNAPSHMKDLSSHVTFLNNMAAGGLSDLTVMGTMHEVGYWEGAIEDDTPCNPLSQYGIAKNALRQSMMLSLLGALVGQLNALLFQILAGLGVGIRNILQHLVKGQQLINVFRRGKQRNTAALVQHLHTDDLLFIFCPAVIVFCLLLVNFSLLIGDLLFFFHDLCADIINLVIQRIDLALDGVFLLHKQLFLLLGFGFIAGNVFQLLADLVQFRLQLVLFVFQLFLLIIGMGRHGSIQAQRRGNHGSHQRSPCAPHIAADGNGHFQLSPFGGMRVKRVLAVQKAQGKRRVLRPADVCGCWLQCQCRTAQSQTA